MALTRKERIGMMVLVVAVGIASFLAGRLSLVIEQLQVERPISVVGTTGGTAVVSSGATGELKELIRLSKGPQSGPSITKQ